jgi:hypothetical protein
MVLCCSGETNGTPPSKEAKNRLEAGFLLGVLGCLCMVPVDWLSQPALKT